MARWIFIRYKRYYLGLSDLKLIFLTHVKFTFGSPEEYLRRMGSHLSEHRRGSPQDPQKQRLCPAAEDLWTEKTNSCSSVSPKWNIRRADTPQHRHQSVAE